ncbi:Glycosyltransferase, GT2 family [Modicisalibacter ilicicola DSM 19980]|uniref:Glycosyltransferase, GT2 family n=2 Tax=Modicisalibacter ilicicola TaxID=480814 RepID=A0A1M5BZF7_9GAMM|nr:Glycosyltransferase, GT2 family [Halomonas ilicicola DSM 19980]
MFREQGLHMYKIFAVILTYSRKDLLKRCLDAVYSQTRPCDGVIVIDNASQDETQQLLMQAGYPDLDVYVLSRNIGASGGFNAGFRLAYQSGADLVWVMDDDVIPEVGALKHLLDADERLRRQGIEPPFLLSSAFTEKGDATNTPALSPYRNRIGYPGWPELLEHGIVPVRRATFVSILVPRSTLAEYGLPLAPMFIWGEDTEYTLRVTQDRPGFLVGASKVLHLRQESGPIELLSEMNPERLKYHRHFIRNKLFIARKYQRHYRRFIFEVYEDVRLLFKLLRKGEFHKVAILVQGVAQSLSFSPLIEPADAPVETLPASIHKLELGSRVSSKAVMSKA